MTFNSWCYFVVWSFFCWSCMCVIENSYLLILVFCCVPTYAGTLFWAWVIKNVKFQEKKWLICVIIAKFDVDLKIWYSTESGIFTILLGWIFYSSRYFSKTYILIIYSFWICGGCLILLWKPVRNEHFFFFLIILFDT